jgi:hypothetical protein
VRLLGRPGRGGWLHLRRMWLCMAASVEGEEQHKAGRCTPADPVQPSAPQPGTPQDLQHTPPPALALRCRSQDVICFPPIQRHRYFRLKRRLPSLAARAARNASLACALALGADLALGRGVLSVLLRAALGAWLAATLCSFCWLLGGWNPL